MKGSVLINVSGEFCPLQNLAVQSVGVGLETGRGLEGPPVAPCPERLIHTLPLTRSQGICKSGAWKRVGTSVS